MHDVSIVTSNLKPKKSRKGVGGRPTKYKPEFCEQVVELGKQGLSLFQIAARLSISIDAFNEWREKHSEFRLAVTRAKALAQAWWEDAGMSGVQSREFNAKVWEITMRNRFSESYRESSRMELSGALTIAGVREDDIARAQAVLLQSSAGASAAKVESK